MPDLVDASEPEPVHHDPVRWDPVYLHARRESVEILLAWAVSLGWSVGFCSLQGYQNAEPLSMVLGIPSWVFWGIVVPWVAASLFTFYYSLVRMKTDSLDREPPASEADSQVPSPPRRET